MVLANLEISSLLQLGINFAASNELFSKIVHTAYRYGHAFIQS